MAVRAEARLLPRPAFSLSLGEGLKLTREARTLKPHKERCEGRDWPLSVSCVDALLIIRAQFYSHLVTSRLDSPQHCPQDGKIFCMEERGNFQVQGKEGESADQLFKHISCPMQNYHYQEMLVFPGLRPFWKSRAQILLLASLV